MHAYFLARERGTARREFGRSRRGKGGWGRGGKDSCFVEENRAKVRRKGAGEEGMGSRRGGSGEEKSQTGRGKEEAGRRGWEETQKRRGQDESWGRANSLGEGDRGSQGERRGKTGGEPEDCGGRFIHVCYDRNKHLRYYVHLCTYVADAFLKECKY